MDIQEQFYDYIENNDINNIKSLLNDKRIDPSDENNLAFILASDKGHFDIVKLLLKDKRVNPSDRNNWAIQLASQNGYFDIINLLWKDKRVKTSLKEDCFELYEILIKKDKIKENIEDF